MPTVGSRALDTALSTREWNRLLNTRFHKWASTVASLLAPRQTRRIVKLLHGFQPEAMLTVAHGFSWMTAAAFARRNSLPLHLVVHDDWPTLATHSGRMRSWVGQQFAGCYRGAVSRLCVSPFMAEEYERRYGAQGTVLYPSRGADTIVFETPPARLQHNGPLTCVFAGSVNSPGYARTIASMVVVLSQCNSRLLVYSPLTHHQARDLGLIAPTVELRGLVGSSDLIRECRDEADVLFVPMSFATSERANMELSFPSKLTDYTAMGLPLLIQGPRYCSAVRWAMDNSNVAEVVVENGAAGLQRALHALQNPVYRLALAEAAIRRGHEFFDHTRAEGILVECLRRDRKGHAELTHESSWRRDGRSTM